MSGTTSLDQLPTNAQASSNNQPPQPVIEPPPHTQTENVKIQNYGQQLDLERKSDSAAQISQIDYSSQLNSALKEASACGATVLPSRDIPINTLQMQQDDQVKPDFIPTSETNDYIGNILDREKILLEQKKKLNYADNLDYIYQNLQLPILVGIMYFIFQLPIIRKNLFTFLPNLFNKDGNPKLTGYIFNSVIFALFYTLLGKGLAYLQDN